MQRPPEKKVGAKLSRLTIFDQGQECALHMARVSRFGTAVVLLAVGKRDHPSAGRPIKPMSAYIQRAWLIRFNGCVLVWEVGRCSEIQFFFLLECGLHIIYRTPKDITDKEKAELFSGLHCRQCRQSAGMMLSKPVSSHEEVAWRILRSCFLGPILVEVKILGKRYGAAEIWLPWSANGQRLDLIVMIDGEMHYEDGQRGVDKQKDVDMAFNDMCWQQEHKLLRLYSDEKAIWRECMMAALRMCESYLEMKFQHFSARYAERTNQNSRLQVMNQVHQRKTGAYFDV